MTPRNITPEETENPAPRATRGQECWLNFSRGYGSVGQLQPRTGDRHAFLSYSHEDEQSVREYWGEVAGYMREAAGRMTETDHELASKLSEALAKGAVKIEVSCHWYSRCSESALRAALSASEECLTTNLNHRGRSLCLHATDQSNQPKKLVELIWKAISQPRPSSR